MFIFFFFKQKTAYEMRISDWSSDVCSSDLFLAQCHVLVGGRYAAGIAQGPPGDIAHEQRSQQDAGHDARDEQARERDVGRSEERRVGKECGRTFRVRWSPYHTKNTTTVSND